jgi:hypothetical protein
LYAYQDGQVQFDFDIASGRPELPTPVGHWHVIYKETNFTFYSPWPPGSPFYYYPTTSTTRSAPRWRLLPATPGGAACTDPGRTCHIR